MAENTSKSSLAASVAAMATKNNGRKGADDGKQPFENRESQKAISIRNHEETSSKPGLSNKRLDCGSLRSHNLTLFVRHGNSIDALRTSAHPIISAPYRVKNLILNSNFKYIFKLL